MKKILLTTVAILIALNLMAQLKVSLKGGVSSSWIGINESVSNNETLELSKLTGGYHFRLAAQLKIKKFFIQPEVLFNSNTAEFNLTSLEGVLRDRYNRLDIPVIMGLKRGSWRFGVGPVGHVTLNNNSDLIRQGGFREISRNLTYGYQAGIGLDLWKIQLDFRYEGNFSGFDNFIDFENTNLNLSDSPERFIASVGYIF